MEYEKEKRGYLWHENNSTIERKGTFQIDGKKYYGAIVKSHNNEGQPKYEFMVSLGLLFLKDEKKSEKAPDMSGKVSLNDKSFSLGAWANESEKSGHPYTSLKFTELDDEVGYDANGSPTNEKPLF